MNLAWQQEDTVEDILHKWTVIIFLGTLDFVSSAKDTLLLFTSSHNFNIPHFTLLNYETILPESN